MESDDISSQQPNFNFLDQPVQGHKRVAIGPTSIKSSYWLEVVKVDGNEKIDFDDVYDMASLPVDDVDQSGSSENGNSADVGSSPPGNIGSRQTNQNYGLISPAPTPAPPVEISTTHPQPATAHMRRTNQRYGMTPAYTPAPSTVFESSRTYSQSATAPVRSRVSHLPGPEFYTKNGTQAPAEELKTLKKALVESNDMIAYMSVGEGTPLDDYVKTEVDKLFLIDRRERNTLQNNFSVCIEIIRGLFVGKAAAIANLILPFYVLHEGLYWQVHGVYRLNKRLWAEFQVVRCEVRRMCRAKNDIFDILKKIPDSNVDDDCKVQQIAQCVESRLVYTYTRHGEGYGKHHIERAADTWEGSLYLLVREMDSN